ncbi:hypothetical protein LUZ60_011714 [Juncus effusus]|nr:hypothetical protein LUZ60_011714 [Juncus effusus]
MSSGRNTAAFSGAGAGGGEAEVEELLRAAQDDLLLNLSVNSHSISSSSSLEPDLTRRFQALRSNPSASNSIPNSSANPLSDQSISKDDEMNKVLGEDLAMRFAKLKGGIGPSKAIEFESTISDNMIDGNGDDKQDEVEKVMQWAMDAARLDPSHSHDDKLDEDDEKIDDSSEEEEEEEEEKVEELDKIKQGSKAEGKKNNKKKWFLF